MRKQQQQQQQPRVVLNWNSAGRQFRVVHVPQTNSLVVQAMVGEGWMLLATPTPASWEQSLIVVAMRLVEAQTSSTVGKAPRQIRRKRGG